jgi:arylsulfatase A-like enzyme
VARPDLQRKYQAKAQRYATAGQPEFADEEQNFLTQRARRVRMVQNHAIYAAMVEAMDQAVGKVLDQLDQLGLTQNTVVFFTSDNGGLSTSEGSPTSNLPLRGGKGWLYEGGIREPFLIRWPGVTRPGTTCAEPVISTDFYPTMLAMAGLPLRPGQHKDGLSLVPLLQGEAKLDRESLYWHYPHYGNQGGFPGGAIRMRDWKLIERFEDGRVHLYHLAEDIGERHDVADKHPERIAAMRGRLHAWYQEVDAKFLQPKSQAADAPLPWRPLAD